MNNWIGGFLVGAGVMDLVYKFFMRREEKKRIAGCNASQPKEP